ncbi:MAG: hypothetical protein ACTS3R_09770 [Inquilinaceae bacterium]
MAKAIRSIGRLTAGFARLGDFGGGVGSVRRMVHDGDTITVALDGNLSIRFLGIDTPEISFLEPERAQAGAGRLRFVSLSNPLWEEFLSDPFDPKWAPFPDPLDDDLRDHLTQSAGPGAATNHELIAGLAEDALEALIEGDRTDRGLTLANLRFFMAFAYEVMDGYGRLLCFLNLDEPDAVARPDIYNSRMLESGFAAPYFIWPNVDPFRRQPSVNEAALPPAALRDDIARSPKLREARNAVARARVAKIGIFDAARPLRLQPFELRLLARRSLPERWVIDLGADDDMIHPPQAYHRIERLEDRLFVPPAFVPLFRDRGWRLAGPDPFLTRRPETAAS